MQKIINSIKNLFISPLRFKGLICCLVCSMILLACGEDAILYDVDTDDTGIDSTDDTNMDNGSSDAADDSDPGDVVNQEESVSEVTAYVETTDATMIVHLCGAVEHPGVYELVLGSRVIDGVVKAGGFTDDACEDALNLAMQLSDGCKVYIPTIEEVNIKELPDGGSEYVTGSEPDAASFGAPSDSGSTRQDGKININTANKDQLTTLTGIGSRRAESIIAYREEHGAFKNTEEIMNVTGIKESSYAKIKDSITVN